MTRRKATLSCILLECVRNAKPVPGFSREFRVLVSTATRSGRVLSPGTDVVLEVTRVAANENNFQLSCLRCTLV